MRHGDSSLPGSPEARRALLADVLKRNPEFAAGTLTRPNPESTALSDRDVESCLRQLQEWWRLEPAAEQQPETD
jgi:hypothetical protein